MKTKTAILPNRCYRQFILNNGGCTWYSKEMGFDGEEKVIKIGCDYQHSWDEGKRYDLEYVKRQVEETIDSFLNFIPDYKYWCCGNGNLYDLKDGITIDEVFHSFEYWKEQEWFREKYMTGCPPQLEA